MKRGNKIFNFMGVILKKEILFLKKFERYIYLWNCDDLVLFICLVYIFYLMEIIIKFKSFKSIFGRVCVEVI